MKLLNLERDPIKPRSLVVMRVPLNEGALPDDQGEEVLALVTDSDAHTLTVRPGMKLGDMVGFGNEVIVSKKRNGKARSVAFYQMLE